MRACPGFTWIELATTLAVAALLAALAAPTLSATTDRWRVRMSHDALLAAAQEARSSALFGQTRTRLCPTALCDTPRNWTGGWHRQALKDGQWTTTRVDPPLPPHVRAITHGRGQHHPRFDPDGTSRNENLSIAICTTRGRPYAKKIVIAPSGRIRSEVASDGDAQACMKKVAPFDQPNA
ncbi:type IV fimbrial biogenesis protein FimT [Luteibacter sp. Sphag1AF]|uniref:GspH/FimT family protein n=1 Tax=Luteibacter sp. Sphag1AF TaxID=2587031 RepID=UPI00160759C6|nr:GspH/FimT family protein [Luteibacter sp. Sphag1AF]MBB3229074.1 type IV fimbrial biogenesis protein FimT [Luteibacter sp. Sphag1AF]